MAYEKQTWKTGDVITEEKLNHMEDGIATGGGIYSVNEMYLFDGEVTTEGTPSAIADISLQGEIPKSDIHVTFDGQNYTLPYGYIEGLGDYWGEVGQQGPNFENCPLFINFNGDNTDIYTSEAGTYTLKINETVEKIEPSDAFNNDFLVFVNDGRGGFVLNRTYSEIYGAYEKNKNVRFIRKARTGDFQEFHMASVASDNIVLFYSAYGSEWSEEYSEFKYTTSDGYPSTSDK